MRSAPWADLQRRRPKLALAGVRFLGSADLELPDGAPRGEAHRRPPDLEDWLALLEDYALRCLTPSEAREAGERYDAIARRAAPARLPAHAPGDPPRHLGGGPAADRLAGEGARAGRGDRGGDGGARRRAARARAVRRRARPGAARRRAHRRARPRRGHRPARGRGARRRPAHRAAAPAAGLRPRAALHPRGRRGAARALKARGRRALQPAGVERGAGRRARPRSSRTARSGCRAPGSSWRPGCSCAAPRACS